MKNKRTILLIIILLSFSTLRANTLPKTNEDGKLTDICCAFGVELGKKLHPQLLPPPNQYSKFLDKWDWDTGAMKTEKALKEEELQPNPNYWYEFIPENPYEGFDSYRAHLIDKDSLVYSISASGRFENCSKELSILSDIIMQKYDLTKSPFGLLRDIILFRDITFINKRGTKSINLHCYERRLNGDFFMITYEDSELKTLKDKIYKKKLRSQRNSSGI